MSLFEPPDGVQKISSGHCIQSPPAIPGDQYPENLSGTARNPGQRAGGFGVRKFKNQGFGQRGIPDDAFRHSGGRLYIMMRSFASSLPPGD